jgi:hypothetical protein
MIWFRPKKSLKAARKSVYGLPRWHPLRGLYMAFVNHDKGWITYNKAGAILMDIFAAVILTLFLVAWFIGN